VDGPSAVTAATGLLRRLGCRQEWRAAYDEAIEASGNTAETASLARRRNELG
jgi:RNA polymerase sigma-70 factor, ECF subfamily